MHFFFLQVKSALSVHASSGGGGEGLGGGGEGDGGEGFGGGGDGDGGEGLGGTSHVPHDPPVSLYAQEGPPGLHCVPGCLPDNHRHCTQLPLFSVVS